MKNIPAVFPQSSYKGKVSVDLLLSLSSQLRSPVCFSGPRVKKGTADLSDQLRLALGALMIE